VEQLELALSGFLVLPPHPRSDLANARAAAAAEASDNPRPLKLPAGRECVTCGRRIPEAGWTLTCGICLEEAEGHKALVHVYEGGQR